jgi:hypothetical protein|eukprot:COSAG01_NODE_262_length_19995_cov_33.452855_6_plen_58_part_00
MNRRLRSATARAQAERRRVWGARVWVAVYLHLHAHLPADVAMAIAASLTAFPIDLTA